MGRRAGGTRLDPNLARDKIEEVTLDERVVEMRSSGMTFTEISRELSQSENRTIGLPVVMSSFYRAMDARQAPQSVVEDARQEEMERLYALRSAIWDRAMGISGPETLNAGADQDGAIRSALAIHDRLAKIVGMNAPDKVELTVTVRAMLVQSMVLRLEAAMQEADIPVEQRQQVAALLLSNPLPKPGEADEVAADE